LLRVRDVRISYGRVPAVHGVSLEVAAGTIAAVVGANGAGKSTVLRAVAGLNRIDSGSIELDGAPIQDLPAHRRVPLGLSLVPEGRHLFPRLTVRRNLELGAFTRRDAREIRESLDLVLETFPFLRDRQEQQAGTLSGGEQQMLAIGRALMARPKVMLLDEPSMGLAPVIVQEVFRTIRRLKEEGITLLLVEQFAKSALEVADYAYVMEHGRIAVEGTPAELGRNERVLAAYLG